ncbi:MAG: aminotransferase class IV, partial [Ferruginibacter sp.]
KAKQEKWNDAIVLNTDGRICETTIANIFIIKSQVVFTPQLSEGCVAGVMRKVVIKHLLKENWQIIETAISTTDLFNADEVFLTNSIGNIKFVQRIDEVTYNNILTQKIFDTISPTIL